MAEKLQQETEIYQQLRSCCIKLDEGIVKAGIGMEVGDDDIAAFTVDNYAALKLKHTQRKLCTVPDTIYDVCFSISELIVHIALMSLHNHPSAGLDDISLKILKYLAANSNGQTG